MCMQPEYQCLTLAVKDRVATITLNVPEKMNALDGRMGDELVRAMHEARDDSDVKVVVLTGSGRAFCAGGDVSVFPTLTLEQAVAAVKHEAHAIVDAFTKMPKPVIAAVNGFAVGAGLSLTLLSDIVIASDKAKFGAAFVHIGLIPDIGMLYYLPRLIGLPKAKELAFTGRSFDAAEALSLGIVSRVVEADQLATAVEQMAAALARQPGLSMASTKALMHQGMDMGVDELLELEGFAQGVCMQSEDSKEGVDAFLNKRKANFK